MTVRAQVLPAWNIGANVGRTSAVWFRRVLATMLRALEITSELRGVIGGQTQTVVVRSYGRVVHQEAASKLRAIGDAHAWTVTRENIDGVSAQISELAQDALKTTPVKDARITPEADAEQRAKQQAYMDKWEAEHKRRIAQGNEILVRAPAGAVSMIVAEYRKDESDLMTDYFASSVVRQCVIGWSTSKRMNFSTLRKAAARAGASTLPDIAFLGVRPDPLPGRLHPRDEQRDGGHGRYLSHNEYIHSTGWRIYMRPVPFARPYTLADFEWSVPE